MTATAPRTRTRPASTPKATKPVHNPSQDLMLAATAIFNGSSNQIEVAGAIDGARRIITIRPATMDQLPQIMLFFGGVLEGVDHTKLAQLIDSVVHAQKMAISRGVDPNNINLRELATDELVTKAFGHVSLLATLFAATFQLLPGLVEAFTDIPEADFRKLGIDDATLIAGGIFMLNYRFFTLSLRPILTVFMQSWVSKRAAALAPSMGKASLKSPTR